jgi:NADPH:quinone reductase-like Zn-dependent oxidoreductase
MNNRKAIINHFGTAEQIFIVSNNDLPEPQSHQVRIKIEASTVSTTDIFIRKGIYPLLKDKPPITLGYDFVGIIDKTGQNVTNLQIGDRVADISMIGGNADYIVRNADSLLKVSSNLEAEKIACLVLSGMTAFQIFKHFAKVKKGERFLIHGGTGAVGSTLLQLCQIFDIQAFATSSHKKNAFINAMGARAFDYQDPDYFNKLRQAAGSGFDAVLDFTNQKSFNQSFQLLKKGGRLTTCAVYTEGVKIQQKTMLNFIRFGMEFGLMMLKLSIWNALSNGKSARFFGILDSKKEQPQRFQEDFDALVQLVEEGKIKPVIHEVLPLENAKKAHEMLGSGSVIGHLIIKND